MPLFVIKYLLALLAFAFASSPVAAITWSLETVEVQTLNRVLLPSAQALDVILGLQQEALAAQQQQTLQSTRGQFTNEQVDEAVGFLADIGNRHSNHHVNPQWTDLSISLIINPKSLKQSYEVNHDGRLVTRPKGQPQGGAKGLIVAKASEVHGAVQAALEALNGRTSNIKHILEYIKDVLGLHVPRSWIEAIFRDARSIRPQQIQTPGPPAPMDTPLNPKHRWNRATTPRRVGPEFTTPRRRPGPEFPTATPRPGPKFEAATPRGRPQFSNTTPSSEHVTPRRRPQFELDQQQNSAQQDQRQRENRNHELDLSMVQALENGMVRALEIGMEALGNNFHQIRSDRKLDDSAFRAHQACLGGMDRLAALEEADDEFREHECEYEQEGDGSELEHEHHDEGPQQQPETTEQQDQSSSVEDNRYWMATGVASAPPPPAPITANRHQISADAILAQSLAPHPQQTPSPPKSPPPSSDNSSDDEEDSKPAAKPRATTAPVLPPASQAPATTPDEEDNAVTYEHMAGVMEKLSAAFDDDDEDEELQQFETTSDPCGRCGAPIAGDAGFCQNLVEDPNQSGQQKYCGGARSMEMTKGGWAGTMVAAGLVGTGWRCEACGAKNEAIDMECCACQKPSDVSLAEWNQQHGISIETAPAAGAGAGGVAEAEVGSAATPTTTTDTTTTTSTNPFAQFTFPVGDATATSDTTTTTGGFHTFSFGGGQGATPPVFDFSGGNSAAGGFDFSGGNSAAGGFDFSGGSSSIFGTNSQALEEAAPAPLNPQQLELEQSATGTPISSLMEIVSGDYIMVLVANEWRSANVTGGTRSSRFFSLQDGSQGVIRDVGGIRKL